MEKSLADLRPGETGQVRGLEGGRNLIARLAALGFTIGAPVKVVRRNARGPLLVSLRGTQIALGFGEATRILIGRITAEERTVPVQTSGCTIALV
jgi:ferrous iron transport protein A